MFGALAVGTTSIEGLLEGEDVLRTAGAMRALGAEVTQLAAGQWRVAGRGIGGLIEPPDVLDMGNSGTAARLLCGLLAGHPLFAVMTGDASLRLEVQGHTDDSGSPEHNARLSGDRAASVKDWLIAHGIAASRLTSKGYGATKPVADNHTPGGRAKNRRVDLARI